MWPPKTWIRYTGVARALPRPLGETDMPSPFPGIDPYLESQGHWLDFHARFVPMLSDALNEQLPEGYVARIDERMTLVELPHEDEARLIRPDVAVVRGEV